jgi:hypothetical protein
VSDAFKAEASEYAKYGANAGYLAVVDGEVNESGSRTKAEGYRNTKVGAKGAISTSRSECKAGANDSDAKAVSSCRRSSSLVSLELTLIMLIGWWQN